MRSLRRLRTPVHGSAEVPALDHPSQEEMNPFDVAGKVAVVTGGAKGIGAATVRTLEHAGAIVVAFDTQETAFPSVDVTDERAVKKAVARVAEQHGGIDILINN